MVVKRHCSCQVMGNGGRVAERTVAHVIVRRYGIRSDALPEKQESQDIELEWNRWSLTFSNQIRLLSGLLR